MATLGPGIVSVAPIEVGNKVMLADQTQGTVRFFGKTKFATGEWYGIELKEPRGKNDGSVGGVRYFNAKPLHGVFVGRKHIELILEPSPAVSPVGSRSHTPQPGGARSRPTSLTIGGKLAVAASKALVSSSQSGDRAAKRLSLNPLPASGSKIGKATSGLRSPTKSPTKASSITSSTTSSRGPTPSNGRGGSGGISKRPSLAGPPTTRSNVTGLGRPGLRSASMTGSATHGRSMPSNPRTPARPSISGRGSLTSTTARTPHGLQAKRASVTSDATPQNLGDEAELAEADGASPVSLLDEASPEIFSPQPLSGHKARASLERLQEKVSAAAPASGGPRPLLLSRQTGAAGIVPPSAVAAAAAAAAAASTSSSSVGGGSGVFATAASASNASAAREIDNLKTINLVLESKLLKSHATGAELDHVREECQKYESIIHKLQEKIKPQTQELIELRKHNEEAAQRFETIEQEIQDMHEQLELAVVEREMAEEEAQIAKEELSTLKSRIEELELELELLKDENEESGSGAGPEEKTGAGFIHLQKYNERLKDALLQLHERSLQMEQDLRDHVKSLQQQVEEANGLKEEHDATVERLKAAEHAVQDMKQQIDAAGDIEDIIEDLGHQNAHKDKIIEELRAAVADLEDYKDVMEELEVNYRENEKEMQQEIDNRLNHIQDLYQREAQQQSVIDDYLYTISRFRELVRTLQTDLQDMKASHTVTETESEQLSSSARAMMDLNIKLQVSASKAQVKAIDLELRRLDVDEATEHLGILQLFLPDTYNEDKNSVLSYLRFKRLAFKANLLHQFIVERVANQPHPGNEDDVFHACDALDKLVWVAGISQRFVNFVSHCTLEQFARFDVVLHDLEPIERLLNGWIDSLRRDELKEKQCAADLQRCVAVLTDLAEKHLTIDLPCFADDVHMRMLYMQSHLDSAATSLQAACALVWNVVPTPAEGAEDDGLARDFQRKMETLITKTRSAKVVAGKAARDLVDLRSNNLSLTPDTSSQFETCELLTSQLCLLARHLGLDLHALLRDEGRQLPFTYREVQATMLQTLQSLQSSASPTAMPPLTSHGSDTDMLSSYSNRLATVEAQMTALSNLCGDLTAALPFRSSDSPWFLRARELESSKMVPPDLEEEVKRLSDKLSKIQHTLRDRDEELATEKLATATLRSRMRDAKAEAERIARLEAEAAEHEEEQARLRDQLEQADRELIKLESERELWATYSAAAADGTNGVSGPIADGSVRGGPGGTDDGRGPAGGAASRGEMEALRSQLRELHAAVAFLRGENYRARTGDQAAREWLAEPLLPSKSASDNCGAWSIQRQALNTEGRECLAQLVQLVAEGKVVELSGGAGPSDLLRWRPMKESPAWQAARLREGLESWKAWAHEIRRKSDIVDLLDRTGGLGPESATVDEELKRRRKAAELKKTKNDVLAQMHVRLPDMEGKGVRAGVGGAQVEIHHAGKWEGLVGIRG